MDDPARINDVRGLIAPIGVGPPADSHHASQIGGDVGRLAGRGSAKLPEAAGGSDGEEAGGTVAKRARLQVRQGGVHLPDGDGPVTSDDDLRTDLYRTVTMDDLLAVPAGGNPSPRNRKKLSSARLDLYSLGRPRSGIGRLDRTGRPSRRRSAWPVQSDIRRRSVYPMAFKKPAA